jgi:protein phosphatase
MIHPPPKIHTAARTDPGRDPNKQVNEDAFRLYESDEGLLAVVCDGMGGHQGGRLASGTAVLSMENDFRTLGRTEEPHRLLRESIQRAATQVYDLGGTSPTAERPGTTCVAAWFCPNGLYIAHVGDSRAYRFRQGNLIPLTVDHTVVEAFIAAGQLTREQAKGHPDAHRITRALGITPTVEVELRPVEELRAKDRYLLCSDGLTDMVTEPELSQWLGQTSELETIATGLVALANERGGHDNITVVLVEVDQGASSLETTQTGTQLGTVVPLPKTVVIDAVGQSTLLMNESATPPVHSVSRGTDRERTDRTQPLAQRGYVPPQGNLPETRSYVPNPHARAQARAQRNLWIAIGIAVLLSLLAILVRFLRHRNG